MNSDSLYRVYTILQASNKSTDVILESTRPTLLCIEEKKQCETFVLDCIQSLLTSNLIKRSPRGKIASNLLSSIEEHGTEPWFQKLSSWLVSSIQTCLEHGYSYRLPSHIIGQIWKRFHLLRSEKKMLTIWESHLSVISLPQDLYEESELTLQLLLDEIIQQQIKTKQILSLYV